MPAHLLPFAIHDTQDLVEFDGLAQDLPGPLCDPVLVSWTLSRMCTYVSRALTTQRGDSSNVKLRVSTMYLYLAPELTAKC